MRKNVALAFVFLFFLSFSYSPDVSACGTLSSANTVYTVTNYVNHSGTCFTIGANNITIDCQGNTINFSQAPTTYSYGVYVSGYSTTMIKNCNIIVQNTSAGTVTQWGVGVRAHTSASGLIINNTNITLNNGNYAFGVYVSAATATNLTVVDSQINTLNSGRCYGVRNDIGAGGMLFDNVNITTNCSTYTGDTAAGVYQKGGDYLRIYNSNFTSNTGTVSGTASFGALHLVNVKNVTLLNSSFNNRFNSVAYTAYFVNTNNTFMDNTTFSNWVTTGSGNALRSEYGYNYTIINSLSESSNANFVFTPTSYVFLANSTVSNGSYAIYIGTGSNHSTFTNITIINDFYKTTTVTERPGDPNGRNINNTFSQINFSTSSTCGVACFNFSSSANYFNISTKGNIYFNATSYNIQDLDMDGWADAGSSVPFNSTNTPGLFMINGSDYHPKFFSSPPSITLNAPENTTYAQSSIDVNYTITQGTYAIDTTSCKYSKNEGANVTLSSCENFTLSDLASGTHSVRVYVSDIAGTEVSTDLRFFTVTVLTLDFVDPTLADGTIWANNWLDVNISSGNISPINHSILVDFNRTLEGYWSFDFSNSSHIFGNDTANRNMSYTGGLGAGAIATGKWGYALACNGSSGMYLAPQPSYTWGDLFTTNMSTISFWLKVLTGTTRATYQHIFGDYADSSNNGLAIRIETTGNVSITMKGASAGSSTAMNGPKLNDSTWHMVTFTLNRTGNVTMYVDGVKYSSVDISIHNGSLGTNNLGICGEPVVSARILNGSVDELSVFDNRILNDTEILSLFNASGAQYYFNNTNLGEGSYLTRAFAVERFGVFNYTERTLYVDWSPPFINITAPTNNSVTRLTEVPLNITYYDLASGINLSSCEYRLNNSDWTEIPSCSNMTLPTLADGDHNVTVRIKDNGENLNTSNPHYFTIYSVLPFLNVSSPMNATYGYPVNVNYSASDLYAISTCWYSLDSAANVTIASCANTSIAPAVGAHNIIVYVNNTLGSVNQSQIYFTVEDRPPYFQNLTYNETKTGYTVKLTANISDETDVNGSILEYDFCAGSWTNTSFTAATGTAKSVIVTYTKTIGGADGCLTRFRFWANDSTGQWNVSDTEQFTVTTLPYLNVTLVKPRDTITYPFENPFPVTFWARSLWGSDTVDSCWYSLNESANETLAGCMNFTLDLEPGDHRLQIWANDTGLRENTTNATFTLNSPAPTLDVTSPVENTTYATGIFNLEYTVTTPIGTIDTCWMNFNNGTNITLPGCTNTTFYKSPADYVLYLFVNNSYGNMNSTAISFTTIVTDNPPYFVGIGTNTTLKGQSASFLSYIYDERGISRYTMEWMPCSSVWQNSSIVSAANNRSWLGNITRTLPSTPRCTVYYRFWANDTLNQWNVSDTYSFVVSDYPGPNLSIQSPVNRRTYLTGTIDLNYTVNDSTGLDTCFYSVNTSASNTTLAGCANTTMTLRRGHHNVTVYANNTLTGMTIKSVVFYVDIVDPMPYFSNLTYNQTVTLRTTRFTANISDDHGVSHYQLEWDLCTGTWVNSSLKNAYGTTSLIGFVDRTIGGTVGCTIYFRFWANDTSGQWNVSDTVAFKLTDVPTPIVMIHSPLNTTYQTSSVRVDYTAYDDHNQGLDTCWYSLDGGTNTTLDDCTDINGTLTSYFPLSASDGGHYLIIYARNHEGTVGNASVYFTLADGNVSFTAPTFANSSAISLTLLINLTGNNTNGGLAYAFTDIKSDLIGWYTCDNYNTTHLLDNSTHRFNLTYNNTYLSDGIYNKSCFINQSDTDPTPIIGGHIFNTTRDLTIGGWINPNESTTMQYIVNDTDLSLGLNASTNKAFFRVNQTTVEMTGDTLGNQTWHHLIGTLNGSSNTVKLYINGTLNATTVGSDIGNVTNITYFANGVQGGIDEVIIFRRAMTDAEASYLYDVNSSNTWSLFNNYTYERGYYTYKGYQRNTLNHTDNTDFRASYISQNATTPMTYTNGRSWLWKALFCEGYCGKIISGTPYAWTWRIYEPYSGRYIRNGTSTNWTWIIE